MFILLISINIASIFNETLQRKNTTMMVFQSRFICMIYKSIKTIEFLNYYSYLICQEIIFQAQIDPLQPMRITTASQLMYILSMMSEEILKLHL